MQDAGIRIQDTGYWILLQMDTGCRIKDIGYRIIDTVSMIQDAGYRIQDTEYYYGWIQDAA